MDEQQQIKENPMQEERVFFEQPTINDRDGGKGKVWAVIILFAVLLAGVAGWFVIQKRQGEAIMSPTPTVEQTPLPSSVPQAVSRSEIRVEILNGTGISGEAAVLKGRLIPLGYSDIKTGNATSQNHTKTEVSFSSTAPEDLRNEIVSTLENLYEEVQIGPTITQNEIDVRIITGLRRGSTPKPLVTATPKPSPKSSPAVTSGPNASSTPKVTSTPNP